jgi:LysM repeat protein
MYRHARGAGLHFFLTGRGIRDAAEDGAFVKLRPGRDYTLKGVSYPYVKPTTQLFVERLAKQYRSACGERLVITSATRPRSMHLFNSVSHTVHPTGMAVDLRRSSRASCRNWLRSTLLALEGEGVLEATEEHHPAHFHVAVFPAPYHEYVAEKGVDLPPLRTASASAKATSGATVRYTVRRGDSLWSNARHNSITVARLRAANGLDSSIIQPGQKLVIPGK